MDTSTKRLLLVLAVLGAGFCLWLAMRSWNQPQAADVRHDVPEGEQAPPRLTGVAPPAGGAAEPEARHGRWVEVTVVEAETEEPLDDILIWSVGQSPRREGSTDTAGLLRLGPFDQTAFGLSLRTEGWLSEAPIPLVPEGSADAHVTLRLRRGLAIAGRVLEPGDVPAEGAWVEVQQGDLNAMTATDTEGRFRFPTLSPGKWLVRVRKHFSGPFVKDVEALAGNEDLTIRLAEALPREIIVDVLAPDGAPVPAFDYAWATADGGRGSGDWSDPPLTLDPSMGVRWLEVTKPRDASGKPLLLAPASVGPLLPGQRRLELRLRQGEGISGRVVDTEDKPVPGVHLRAWPLDRGPATGYVAGFHDETLSEADGTFRLSRLAATRYRLHVEVGAGFAPPGQQTVDAGTRDLVVRLQRGASVELTIVDPEGRPVPAANVSVNRRGDFAFGKSDPDGKVTIQGLVGDQRYAVRVRPPRTHTDLAVLVLEDWSPDDRTLRLPQAMPLQGIVVDGEGRPVPGAYVNAIGRDEATYGVQVSEDATFSLPHVSPGPVRVRATKGDLLSPVLDLPDGGLDVRISMRKAASLSVVLGGWPKGLRDIQAVVLMPTFAYGGSKAVVEPDGRATFTGLDPDAHHVLYLLVGERQDQQVAWASDLRAGAQQVVIPLRPAKSISGTVTIPRDAQLPTIEINQEGVRAKAVADESGRFTLTGLPEGTWTVTARASGDDGVYTGTAQAKTGTTVQIDLRR